MGGSSRRGHRVALEDGDEWVRSLIDTANAPKERRADLVATIHESVIPRLLLAHHSVVEPEGPACLDSRLPPTAWEVEEFAGIAVAQDLTRALDFIHDIVRQGLSLETVLLQLLAPAARWLGDEWLADRRTFTDVTVGLVTIQQIVRILGPDFAPKPSTRGQVMLLSPHAEQHTLGIYLLGEFLRRAGWGVQVAPSMPESELLSVIEAEWIEMVGISVSNVDLIKQVGALVSSLRRASLNPDVAVMVGGACAFEECCTEPGTVFCNDPTEAVRWLEKHVSVSGDRAGRV